MDIPRFAPSNLNPRLMRSGIGDAFQEFVHQVLLSEFPQLHRFPGGGKDGAIDLIDTSNGCIVIECKFVGKDDYSEIERRWGDVKSFLEKHLREPSGPTLGQSQYGPWYSSYNPISEYWFCLSGVISHEQQRRNLKKIITHFFEDLATQRPHLSHLQKLKVEIVDWNDLTTRLQKWPHLIFRWFPGARPGGLIPLDEAVDVGTFRAYLTNAKLPYYSLAEHLRSSPAPNGSAILDEETLLSRFDSAEITGLIISGKGGVGKSRLTLELGWLALRKGWAVMRVYSRLKEDALEQFAEKLSPDSTALLLVDYIETQSDFGELVESINLLNDSGVARLRYVAACRTGYYHKAIAASERHLPVDLTPPPGSAIQDWFAGYRQKTIERILSEAGLPNSEKYLNVCHNIPILAVFLAYLHASGRTEDLTELLGEIEFGQWVLKRIQLTFRERIISRDLARLIPLFPMVDSTAVDLTQNVNRPILDSLATDGWVEKLPTNVEEERESWVTAHDVLADQILLSYVRSIPDTAEIFIGELLAQATELQSIRSALVSLQRVSDAVPLNAIRWHVVIADAIALNLSSWRNVRDLLTRTTTLSVPDRLSLLRSHYELWTDAESDLGFQKSLGWFARWVVKQGQGVVEKSDKDALISWIAKASRLAERSNFIITWGLRLAPDLIREPALSWIQTKPTLLQTHYLMVAWLDCGLPANAISPFVRQWCEQFSQSFHLSFLTKAWLDAGGEKELVEEVIKEWLVKHRSDAEARFVYNAWLDAGGEKELVQEAIKDWLVGHRGDAEARFVYDAWLDAGGEKELVREAIKDWLVEHRRFAEASHVYKAWLDAGGEKGLVQEAIKDWLVEHRGDTEAQFVFKAWLEAGGEKELVQESIKDWLVEHRRFAEASHVYNAWLDADGEKGLVREAIKDWLAEHRGDTEAQFVYNAWLDAGGEKELVQEAIKDWLVEHRGDAEAQFVYTAWLDAGGEKELVREAIKDWLVKHRGDAKAQFVYTAWLDAGGEKELVQEAIKDWLAEHRGDAEARFVYDAWLDAGGEKELVQEPIKDWLVEHRRFAEASHVYKAWLDAGGEKFLVRDAIKDWLCLHNEDSDADHVFRSWLESNGERDVVWEAAIAWLSKHRAEESAVYITKFIAKQPNLSATTIKDVLAWCRTFPRNEDALWRLTQLRDNLFAAGIAEDLISATEAVLMPLLPATSKPHRTARIQIAALLFVLITSQEMQSDRLRERVDFIFLNWLKHPLSFGRGHKTFWSIQHVGFMQRFVALIDSGILDPAVDREPLDRFLQWIDEWTVESKETVRPLLDELKGKYHALDLWDIVRFDGDTFVN